MSTGMLGLGEVFSYLIVGPLTTDKLVKATVVWQPLIKSQQREKEIIQSLLLILKCFK